MLRRNMIGRGDADQGPEHGRRFAAADRTRNSGGRAINLPDMHVDAGTLGRVHEEIAKMP
jgi:hypothetical protein